MVRTFSLATLLMVVAIVGVALASIRGVWMRVEEGAPAEIVILMGVGAVAGAVFGFALAIWNRDKPVWKPAAWPWIVVNSGFGSVLGAAAGAQVSAPVGWWVVLLAPVIMIGSAALVAANRRRQFRLLALQTPPAEPRGADLSQAVQSRHEPRSPDEPVLADEAL